MFSPKLRLVVLTAAVAAVFAAALVGLPHTPSGLRALAADAGVAAPLALFAAWLVLTPALVSGTLLAATSGLLLGPALGTPLALAGATLGGLVAFALARRGGRDPVEHLSGPRLSALQQRIGERGFTTVLCLRAAPGVPATLLNYAAGLSRVRARDYLAATLIGGAPRVAAYTALGGSLTDPSSPLGYAAVGLLMLMAMAGGAGAWLGLRRRPARRR